MLFIAFEERRSFLAFLSDTFQTVWRFIANGARKFGDIVHWIVLHQSIMPIVEVAIHHNGDDNDDDDDDDDEFHFTSLGRIIYAYPCDERRLPHLESLAIFAWSPITK